MAEDDFGNENPAGIGRDSSRSSELPDSADPAEWLEKYGDAMFRFAMTKLRDRSQAEEIVQETLLAALRSKSQFRGQSKVSTWLFSILRFKVADFYRSKQRDEVSLEDQPQLGDTGSDRSWSEDPAAVFEDQEFWKTFQSCVDKLPEKFAEVYILREVNRHSPGEICKILDISPTNLSMRLHRCRLALRDCLQKNWFRDEES